MTDRLAIAEEADSAARRAAQSLQRETNPYPAGSEEAAAWDAAYWRFLVQHSAPEGVEGSA